MADLDTPELNVPIEFIPSRWDSQPIITDTADGEHWMVTLECSHPSGILCFLVEAQDAVDFAGKVLESAVRADAENDSVGRTAHM